MSEIPGKNQVSKENQENARKYLKQLIISETNLKFPDDEFLVRFLVWSDWDYRKAFDRLQKYYACRRDHAIDYERHRPSKSGEFINRKIAAFSSLGDGRKLFLSNYSNWDPEQFDGHTLAMNAVFIFERLIDDPETRKNGVVGIGDFRNMNAKQVLAVVPSALYIAMNLILNALPIHLIELHMIATSALFPTIDNIMRFFVPDSLKKFYHVHSDLESLHKHIDKALLPRELGGNLGEINCNEIEKDMVEWEKTYWNKNSKYGNPAH